MPSSSTHKTIWEILVSQKTLSLLSLLLIVAMLLPLVVIALYNYPGDDDFSFTLPATRAWAETGSLWETLKAVWEKTRITYMEWQGYFVSTFFFGLTPMVFDLDLYFISIEDLKTRAHVGSSAIEALRNQGALEGLPESSQVDLFSLMM